MKPFFRCAWRDFVFIHYEVDPSALQRAIPDGNRYLTDGSMEIVSARRWYRNGRKFSMTRVLRAWDVKLAQASARGYAGIAPVETKDRAVEPMA